MSDFTNLPDIGVPFTAFELDEDVDFTPTGDMGQIIISGSVGFGEGGFGEGGFGGDATTVVINGATTAWTNIDEP